jgi:hypothetical protein
LAQERKPNRSKPAVDRDAVTEKQVAELVLLSKKMDKLGDVAREDPSRVSDQDFADFYRYVGLIHDLLDWYSRDELAKKSGLQRHEIGVANDFWQVIRRRT